MTQRWRKTLSFSAALPLTAFLLNFCWESLHGLLFEAHPGMPADEYVPMMLFMALMDTLGIVALYLFTALIVRRWSWVCSWRNNSIFFLSALAAAFTIEYISINVLHLWHYRTAMPVVFGVGLLPLFQLALTGLLSVFVAGRFASNS
ncbi:MAG: hypothetical protein HGA99_09395 [Chlorobiaceae bacterium]|nr:hypothetical protein [Chlorobiaceae bacterium]